MTDVLRILSERGLQIEQFVIRPDALAELVGLAETLVINSNTAKEVFEVMLEGGGSAAEIVRSRGLAQVSDTGVIEKIVDEVISGNEKSAQDYKAGKDAALKYLVGQVMKLSKGKANPQMATDLLVKRLRA
jgi:aspartyl-tRNA(Asn)/glutamyl-tRNA(Gln) amidotransferase subunit B